MAIKGRLGTIGGTVLNAIAIYFMLSAATEAQTKIDLSNQSRSVDFSSAVSTKPIRMGTTLPAVCTQGEAFFKTNAVAGNNIYWCVAMNVWTLQAPKLAGDYTAAQITNAVDVTQTNSYSAGARQIFNPSAATTLRIVSKLGLRSPESAL